MTRTGSTRRRRRLAPWLFCLARHKAIDLVRREANIRKRTADVDLEFHEADDDVDHETWLNFRRERVREAIEELTPTQREALELAFFQGLTHVEVSERLGHPARHGQDPDPERAAPPAGHPGRLRLGAARRRGPRTGVDA